MDKVYERINWQNEPSVATPINATNLNKIDYALDALDDRVIELNKNQSDDNKQINEKIDGMQRAITKTEEALNTKAQGIICNASGNPVVITDCSDMAFSDIEVDGSSEQEKIIGKNHLNITTNTVTQNGITATINADKSISISGSSTARVVIALNYGESGDELDGTYYLTGTNEKIFLSAVVNGSDVPSTTDMGDGVQVTFDKSVGPNKNWIRLSMAEEIDIYDQIVIYPLLRKCDESGNPIGDDTYEPYTVIGPSLEYSQRIKSVGDDGSLTIKISNADDTESNTITIPLEQPLRECDKIVKQDGLYGVLRGTKVVPFGGTWRVRTEFSPSDGSVCYSSADFITDNMKSTEYMYMACTHLIFGGGVVGGVDISRKGKKGCFYKISIYVSTGGTTTYVCSDAPTLADFMEEMEGAMFEYELAEPVFEPFPEEVQKAIADLHGYKPVTYITTDSEVHPIIDVDYVADTKIYIDNKIIELATAMVAGSEV